MYANDGKCLLDMRHLGRITGCRNFEKVWHKIKTKFQLKGDYITHKRVSRELRKAKRLMQAKRKSGLRGAEKRWQSHSKPNGRPSSKPNGKSMANKNKNKNKNTREDKRNEIEKEEEIISNTYSNSSLRALRSSIPLRTESDRSFQVQGLHFYDALIALIRPRSQSDRTSFHKISRWLVEQCEAGDVKEEIFKRAYGYAQEARKGRNPAAVFTSLLKRELGYK